MQRVLIRHGHKAGRKESATHYTWRAMKARCDQPKHQAYPYYGGRGITYEPRWTLFEHFLADMGLRPDGMTLDRKDTNGHYTADNCKWATKLEQMKNQRPKRASLEARHPERELRQMCWLVEMGYTKASVARMFGTTDTAIARLMRDRN